MKKKSKKQAIVCCIFDIGSFKIYFLERALAWYQTHHKLFNWISSLREKNLTILRQMPDQMKIMKSSFWDWNKWYLSKISLLRNFGGGGLYFRYCEKSFQEERIDPPTTYVIKDVKKIYSKLICKKFPHKVQKSNIV